eukprot:8152589-Pyramimonas_sp.AAC.2
MTYAAQAHMLCGGGGGYNIGVLQQRSVASEGVLQQRGVAAVGVTCRACARRRLRPARSTMTTTPLSWQDRSSSSRSTT